MGTEGFGASAAAAYSHLARTGPPQETCRQPHEGPSSKESGWPRVVMASTRGSGATAAAVPVAAVLELEAAAAAAAAAATAWWWLAAAGAAAQAGGK